MRVALGVLLLCWPLGALAGSVTGRVSVFDKRGRPARDLQDTVVWIDDVKGHPKPTNATIYMQDKGFRPSVTVVPEGATVTFPNQDPILHNAFSVSGANHFDLGLYKRPQSASWTFKHPGLVRVYCNIHPQMSAVVWVMDSSFYAKASSDGNFELKGVPPGRHVLKAWHPRGGQSETMVVVPAGEGRASAELQLDASKYRRRRHKRKDGSNYGPGERY